MHAGITVTPVQRPHCLISYSGVIVVIRPACPIVFTMLAYIWFRPICNCRFHVFNWPPHTFKNVSFILSTEPTSIEPPSTDYINSPMVEDWHFTRVTWLLVDPLHSHSWWGDGHFERDVRTNPDTEGTALSDWVVWLWNIQKQYAAHNNNNRLLLRQYRWRSSSVAHLDLKEERHT